MRMSVNRGLAVHALLATLCAGLAGCTEDAKPTKVDPEQPLVQRPRRPEPREDSPFRDPAKDPPSGREGEQIDDAAIEAALAAAKTALEQGNRSVATRSLLECANKIPASARCDGELGLVYATVKPRKAEALYYLSEAARVDDAKADAALYDRVSDVLRQHGRFDDAVSAAELALARQGDAQHHVALSRVLQTMPEHLERAARELGEAVALEPENHELLHEQATVLAQVGTAESASGAADLFQRYLEQASPPEERKQATTLRIAELREVAERLAKDERKGAKKSG